MARIKWYGPTLVLLVTVIVVMIAGPHIVRDIEWTRTNAQITFTRDVLQKNPTLSELSDAFRKVAQIVEPSVVHIQVLSRQRSAPGGRLDPFEEFRRRFDPDYQPSPQPDGNDLDRFNAPVPIGSGSGWVYDDKGHIITNNHVIENAEQIVVRFIDGSEFAAEVVGTDPKTDVAVLKIDAGSLHPAKRAAEAVEQGDIVFAFGSPFRFDFSMSQGIVSGKGRQLGILRQRGGYENFIQTDAAINPGNSGGPLTNIYGEVIGMNTAIASPGSGFSGRAGFVGLGFAIPVRMVQNVADQILEDGRVRRGYIGVFIADLEPALARSFGFEGEGVLVEDVSPDGPGAEAGLKAGDIITHINDKQLDSADALRLMVSSMGPGTTVKVRVFRQGETKTFELKLGELPGEPLARRPSQRPDAPQEPGDEQLRTLQQLGIEKMSTYTEQASRQYVIGFTPGVLVEQVRPGSVASAAGLARGVIISEVNGKDIESVDDLVEALREADPDKPLRLQLQFWNPRTRSFVQRYAALELSAE